MTKYVALVRGVNVGGRARLAMADLRELLRGLGYRDVSTFLQSGNALFTSSRKDTGKLAREIERAVAKELDLNVACLVRSEAELRRVVDQYPLSEAATDPSRTMVLFLSEPPDPALIRDLDPKVFAPEEFGVGIREVYVWCPDGMLKSKVMPAFSEKRLGGVVATARNWRTVSKLLVLME